MGAIFFRRGIVWLLAGLHLPHLGTAQTIETEDGAVVAADPFTVAPAVEAVNVETTAGVPVGEVETLQLTHEVIANLTSLHLSNVSLFDFPSEVSLTRNDAPRCKTFPGDSNWPSNLVWKVFDLLTGGALIETVPIGAVCYQNSGFYDAAKCQNVRDKWAKTEIHANHPSSVMNALYQGATCMPEDGVANSSASCTLGGFPAYSLSVRNVAQIQLAINFARNTNIRLVVKNTGHDYLGKSTGAGALSIWTHHLKTIKFLDTITTPSYRGPAFKLGAGVQVFELYEAAHRYNVTAVGGECEGVGVTGGYTAGGGHSMLSSLYGMGADQAISIDVVLPSGRFVTASETENTDLFWAIRGGGGATFGVVTSMTVKVYPRMSFVGATWSIPTPDLGISDELFFRALFVYWRKFPGYSARGAYAYQSIFPLGAPGAGYIWNMNPWVVPGMPLAEFKTMIAPLLAEWGAIGLNITPTYFEHDNLYDTWRGHFPEDGALPVNLRTASRLFPARVWENAETLEGMMEGIKSIMEEGSALIQHNLKADAPEGTPDSAVNTHWRDATMLAIVGGSWTQGSQEEYNRMNRKITEDWMARLRRYGPGSYGNEGDLMEPEFGEAFYGTNYPRLLKIKRRIDPDDVFWAPTAVGSERWDVRDGDDVLTVQNGRLCKAY